MKRLTLAFGIGLLASAAPMSREQAPVAHHDEHSASTAGATLIDTQGRPIGEALLTESPHGVLLRLDLRKATPGVHGLHIHDVGSCEGPTFTSAGGHFNPSGKQHGFLNALGPHAGDLPNIAVPGSTHLSVDYFVADVTLGAGPRSLLDSNGSAIVIHAEQDDYVSDPAGHAGERLACGKIERS